MDTYDAFFLHYLREHSKPGTRAWHYVAAAGSLGCLAWGIFAGPWWVALLAPVAGYGPAWFSHMAIERNRPATFRHPLWSLLGDYHMTFLALTGRLGPKLAEARRGADPKPAAGS